MCSSEFYYHSVESYHNQFEYLTELYDNLIVELDCLSNSIKQIKFKFWLIACQAKTEFDYFIDIEMPTEIYDQVFNLVKMKKEECNKLIEEVEYLKNIIKGYEDAEKKLSLMLADLSPPKNTSLPINIPSNHPVESIRFEKK